MSNISVNELLIHYLPRKGRKEGRKFVFNDALNTFYLRLYGVRHIVREVTYCRRMCYYFRLTARVLLYAQSHRQDSTYHGLCYTSRGALAETRAVDSVTGAYKITLAANRKE